MFLVKKLIFSKFKNIVRNWNLLLERYVKLLIMIHSSDFQYISLRFQHKQIQDRRTKMADVILSIFLQNWVYLATLRFLGVADVESDIGIRKSTDQIWRI